MTLLHISVQTGKHATKIPLLAEKQFYQFPRAAVTNYQKRGDAEQQEFIPSQFWR